MKQPAWPGATTSGSAKKSRRFMAKRDPREYNPFEALPKKRALTHPRPEADKHSDVQTAKPLAKSQNPAYAKFTTYIPVELHRQVKSKTAAQGREMSALIEELLKGWVG